MSRRIPLEIPGPDRRIRTEDALAKGVEAAFAPDLLPPFPLVVEIGFGRGEFLIDLAESHPQVGYLGVEYSTKRVLKMARRVAKLPVANLRIMEARGEEVVGELLAPGSVHAFWINFPDPWPKTRHHPRRLLQAPLIRALALRLEPGGELHVATDHVQYAEQIGALLAAEALLENALAPLPFASERPGRLVTAYQDEWRREGRPLHFFAYRRHAGPAT